MRIKVLTEDASSSEAFGHEHGLSLYIETAKHKILFDFGETGLFLENARKLGVDVGGVDVAFVSHGHDDHGGGLCEFFRANGKAKVYIHKRAFEPHYAIQNGKPAFIGLDKGLADSGRLVFVDHDMTIDDELELFTGVEARKLCSESNKTLLMEAGPDKLEPDDFIHEQNLIITDGGVTALITGCAHRGIINIMERFDKLKGRHADVVLGGFHLSNPNSDETEGAALVDAIAELMEKYPARYYTGHCTGAASYSRLKAKLGDRLGCLSAGVELTI